MASLIHGAKAFLLVVFAHRIRQREQLINSFRHDLWAEQEQDGARFLAQAKDWQTGDFTAL